MKNKKFPHCRNNSKIKCQNRRKRQNRHPKHTNTQTHNCPPSLSNTDIQQKVAGLNQFYLHKPALPAKRRGHANVIHT